MLIDIFKLNILGGAQDNIGAKPQTNNSGVMQ
jgi:hypothetical protein